MRAVGIAVLWLALFFVVGVGLTITLSELVPGVGGRAWWLARNGVYQLVGFLAASWVVGRLLNRYGWDRMGWRPPASFGRHFLRGLGVGAGMAAVAIGLAVVTGRAAVRLTAASGFAGVAGPLAVGMLAASLSEELMFRGYPLRRLADAVGPGVAVTLLAVGFAAAHLANMRGSGLATGNQVLAMMNIALAAVWLAVAFFSTGGIALAWGLHYGWNAALGVAFDAPVSGLTFDVPGIDYTPGTHAWIDGGSFGPEGGVIGTLVLLSGLTLVLGRGVRAPRAWLTAAAA